MPPALDLTGQTYGRLTALRFYGAVKGRRIWLCSCSCGAHSKVTAGELRGGGTKSCGCLDSETTALRNTTHGKSGERIYRIWQGMLERCTNPNKERWKNYGGRGIRVCKRWHKFENFYTDMGNRPIGMSLDRIDNDGNYEPGNVRWATQAEQVRNKSNSFHITYEGKTQIAADWAREIGLGTSALTGRLRRGWSVEQAITIPKLRKGTRRPNKRGCHE